MPGLSAALKIIPASRISRSNSETRQTLSAPCLGRRFLFSFQIAAREQFLGVTGVFLKHSFVIMDVCFGGFLFCFVAFVMKCSWLGDLLSLRAAVHTGFWQNGFDSPCFTKHQHLDDSNSPSNTPTKPISAELDMICSLRKGGTQDLSSAQN